MSLFIDLSSIRKNIKEIKKVAKKDVMAVIKDNAYGLGSKKIIHLLKDENINWIVYNTYKEYLIDKVLINELKMNVLILESPSTLSLNDYYERLHYSINSVNDLTDELLKVNHQIFIHLQVDTGMNRIGIRTIDELKRIIIKLITNENIKIEGIYTHYASNVDEINYYVLQEKAFTTFVKIYPFHTVHSQATSSILKESISNTLRVGLGLYGYGNKALKQYPALSLYTKIVNSFKVKKGDVVGYNQAFTAPSAGYIYVIPLGYNDIVGIDHVLVNDKRLQIVGMRCMNHSFLFSADKIDKIKSLKVLSKSDIIEKEHYNWYHILTSLKNMPKNYIERTYYDIPSTIKKRISKNKEYRFRRRSD